MHRTYYVLYAEWTQKIQAKNAERLVTAVMERPVGTPLVTVCNHTSYIDDPGFYREFSSTVSIHCIPLSSLVLVYCITGLFAVDIVQCISGCVWLFADLIPLRSVLSERSLKW